MAGVKPAFEGILVEGTIAADGSARLFLQTFIQRERGDMF